MDLQELHCKEQLTLEKTKSVFFCLFGEHETNKTKLQKQRMNFIFNPRLGLEEYPAVSSCHSTRPTSPQFKIHEITKINLG